MTISLHPLTPRTRLYSTGGEVTVAGDATTDQSVHTTWHRIHTVCTYCFKTHAIHEHMHKRMYIHCFVTLSPQSLTSHSHHLNLQKPFLHTLEIPTLPSLALHSSPHTPSLTLHPLHPIPHFSLPHLIPHPLLSLSP